MQLLKTEIDSFKKDFDTALHNAGTLAQLDEVRVAFLGRKGKLTALMQQLKNCSVEEKKEFGPLINELKLQASAQFEAAQTKLTTAEQSKADNAKKFFDVTAYTPDQPVGSIHPMTQVRHDIEDIFTSMGYQIADGPEAETDTYNFEALNIPKEHPARDMFDTFWLDVPDMLLRTHTSPVQIHELEKKDFPLAVVAPGRVFRHEATDASHDYVFQQLEGLLVDKNISISHLIATMKHFMQAFFQKEELNIRIRPSYFPFVEPGLEIDIECPFCNHGCSVCQQTEWIEACGAGLVHPNVLEFSDVDAKKYSGFAFGFGLTRLTMLKYGINDIRLLHSANIEFLKQF